MIGRAAKGPLKEGEGVVGLLGHVWQAWRSVMSVLIAVGITVALFIYSPSTLQSLIQMSSGVHDWVQHFVGGFSPRGEAAFTLAISDSTTFLTGMIVFVRAFVMSLVMWVVTALRVGL